MPESHLPECPATNCGCEQGEECGPTCIHTCICSALRACEARVTERHNAEHEDDRLAAFQNGYDAAIVKERKRSVLLIADAYGKGLDAAREAVAALSFDSLSRDQGPVATQRQALAAIDARRGAE